MYLLSLCVILILLQIILMMLLNTNVNKIFNGNPEDVILNFCSHDTERCKRPAGLHSCCVDHLVQMLDDLTHELGPKIFILFGTLLAYKRYDGKHMIPHDDDLDTGILAEHENLLKKAIPNLEKLGYVIELRDVPDQGSGPDPGCSSLECDTIKYPPGRWYVMKYSKKNSLHVDIALLNKLQLKTGEKFLVDAPKNWVDSIRNMEIDEIMKYKTWIYPENYILPVISGFYLNTNMYYPTYSEKLLEYIYGKNYMKPYNRDKLKEGKPVTRLLKNLNSNNNLDIGLGDILIINLDKDTHRLHHVFVQCRQEKLFSKKAANCCTGELTDIENDRFTFNKVIGRDLTNAEKKCFLSHEMCWKKASESKLPSLIVEDDVSFPFDIKTKLKVVIDHMNMLIHNKIIPKATVVRLGRSWYDKRKQIGNTCLAYTDFGTGAWAYIVTPEAADKLLKRTSLSKLKNASDLDKLTWPSDHFFNTPNIIDKGEKIIWEDIDSNYLHLDLYYDHPMFKDIKFRYNITNNDNRKYLIQELSTVFKSSRSAVPDF